MRRIKAKNQQKEYKLQLKEEKKKYSKGFHIETSKLFAIYLFVLMNAIIIYSMVAMWKFQDFSYLGVLISDIAAQILIYGIYCMKAFKAKKSEEELKFKKEKYNEGIVGPGKYNLFANWNTPGIVWDKGYKKENKSKINESEIQKE